MPRLCLSALCGLLLLMAVIVPAEAGGKLKPAMTPEQALANLRTAAAAGDVEGFLAQIGPPIRAVLEFQVKGARLREVLDKLLNEKFGKDPGSKPRTLADELKSFPKLDLQSKEMQGKDKALLTLWMHTKSKRFDKQTKDFVDEMRIEEQKWPAVKQAGAWKVLPPFFGGGGKSVTEKRKGRDGKEVTVHLRMPSPESEKRAEAEREWLKMVGPKMHAAVEKVLAHIKNGKFKDRKEARKAMFEAEDAVRKEFPPPGTKVKVEPSPKEIKK